jgi:hypothetical protein
MFQANHLLGAMGHEVVDHILVAQPLSAGHGVVEMMLQAVMALRHAGRPSFRRHGVAAHGIDLGHQHDIQRRIRLGGGDRSAEPGAACADNGDVHHHDLHSFAPRQPIGAGTIESAKWQRLPVH